MFVDNLLFVGASNAELELFEKVAVMYEKRQLIPGDQLEEPQNARLFRTTTCAESKLMKHFRFDHFPTQIRNIYCREIIQ